MRSHQMINTCRRNRTGLSSLHPHKHRPFFGIALIAEATTTAGQLRLGASHVSRMEDAVYRQLLGKYNEEATRFSRSLGGGDFKLQATWKQREMHKKSQAIAKSLRSTMYKERQRIGELPQGERTAARKNLVEYKSKQLDSILDREAAFQAKTDILAHSGIADVSKATVMNFMNLGERPCPICEGISAGNPYTIQQATTLGALAHPNCLCTWEEVWSVDENLLANARRQVEDGEVRVWDGSPRTPARGVAVKKAERMRERKGGWAGRRTEQRKVITQRTGTTGKALDANLRRYQREFRQRTLLSLPTEERIGPIEKGPPIALGGKPLTPVRGIRPVAQGAFVPKSTTKEVQDWAEERYGHINWSLKSAPPESANAIVAEFDRFAQHHPIVADRISLIRIGELPPDVVCRQVPTIEGKSELIFNRTYWAGDVMRFKERLASDLAHNWHPPGSGRMEGIVGHELGHSVLQEAIDTGKGEGMNWYHKFKQQAGDISGYAKFSRAEMFAEGFTFMEQNPRSVWPESIQALARLIGEWAL